MQCAWWLWSVLFLSTILCLMIFVEGLVYGGLVVVLLAVAVVELVRWPDVVVDVMVDEGKGDGS